ncbi:WRKY DNA-binding transcription factor 70-like [Trifolium pratense]|uniref:WRKY DNA-binding transcription factor 70-like n=1 Tax=Trifolium pratense TaxID=57577 RepID=UPI001E69439F|nr:WRKY DNA-binding transcription factor 70-like [Trifolium pratense]
MENTENLAHGRGKVIDELLRGRELANQLRHLLNESGDIDHNNNDSTTPFAENLLKEVLMTFTNSLLFLNNNNLTSDVSDAQLTKSEDSLESNCKSTSIVKERRGCYKRRKVSQTWEKESEQPEEDGHQWRKYGQKKILHNDFPRNYYRCTHKYEQGCKATKQVQKIQEDPLLHKTTYYGHHTCRLIQNPEIIVDSLSPAHHSSMFLSFDNSFPTPTKQDCPFLSTSSHPSSTSPSVKKEECKEEIVNPPPPPPPPSSSHNDYLSGLTFDDSDRHVTLSSTLDSHDHLGVNISDILYDDVLNWPLS